MQYALLVTGFILFVGFFVAWFLFAIYSKYRKKQPKKSFWTFMGIGVPLALGGLAMIIIGLLVK